MGVSVVNQAHENFEDKGFEDVGFEDKGVEMGVSVVYDEHENFEDEGFEDEGVESEGVPKGEPNIETRVEQSRGVRSVEEEDIVCSMVDMFWTIVINEARSVAERGDRQDR